MRIPISLAALAAVIGNVAPADAQITPPDSSTVADSCGGDVDLTTLPASQRRQKLSCFTRESVRQMNGKLPTKVDDVTTLERIESMEATIIYHFNVDVASADLKPGMADALKAQVTTNVCRDEDMRSVISWGGSYRYYYRDRARTILSEFLIDRC